MDHYTALMGTQCPRSTLETKKIQSLLCARRLFLPVLTSWFHPDNMNCKKCVTVKNKNIILNSLLLRQYNIYIIYQLVSRQKWSQFSMDNSQICVLLWFHIRTLGYRGNYDPEKVVINVIYFIQPFHYLAFDQNVWIIPRKFGLSKQTMIKINIQILPLMSHYLKCKEEIRRYLDNHP